MLIFKLHNLHNPERVFYFPVGQSAPSLSPFIAICRILALPHIRRMRTYQSTLNDLERLNQLTKTGRNFSFPADSPPVTTLKLLGNSSFLNTDPTVILWFYTCTVPKQHPTVIRCVAVGSKTLFLQPALSHSAWCSLVLLHTRILGAGPARHFTTGTSRHTLQQHRGTGRITSKPAMLRSCICPRNDHFRAESGGWGFQEMGKLRWWEWAARKERSQLLWSSTMGTPAIKWEAELTYREKKKKKQLPSPPEPHRPSCTEDLVAI